MSMRDFIRTNVVGIISNLHGEILIAQRAYNKKLLPGAWHLPGGKVEEGEDTETALRRELQEEFQLNDSDIKSFRITDKQFEYQLDEDWHRIILGQITLAHDFIPVLNFETEQAVFLTPKEFIQICDPNEILFNQHVNVLTELGYL